MTTRAEDVRVAYPLFQAGRGGSSPTSALQLRIEGIPFEQAVELNRHWHSILPRFGTGFVKRQPFPCFAAIFDGLIYGVAIWSNPAARNLPQQTWLELRRMALPGDAPKNTASRMLRIMRTQLHRDRPHVVRVVSYSSKSVHAAKHNTDDQTPDAICHIRTMGQSCNCRPAR